MDKNLIMIILVAFCVIITITSTSFSIYILKINNFKKLKNDVVTFSNTLEYLKTDVSNSYNTLLSDIRATKKDYITTLETAKKQVNILSSKIEVLKCELDSILIDSTNHKVSKEYLIKKYPENRTNFNIKVKHLSEKPKIESKVVPNCNEYINKEVTIGDLVNKNNKE